MALLNNTLAALISVTPHHTHTHAVVSAAQFYFLKAALLCVCVLFFGGGGGGGQWDSCFVFSDWTVLDQTDSNKCAAVSIQVALSQVSLTHTTLTVVFFWLPLTWCSINSINLSEMIVAGTLKWTREKICVMIYFRWPILISQQVIPYLNFILNEVNSKFHLLTSVSLESVIFLWWHCCSTCFPAYLTCILNLFEKTNKHVYRGCMHSKAQQRLLANRSPRYWLMSSVRLQPEERFWFRMTLTLALVGVGLQSKHVHLDQFQPAGGVITWGELQSLKWTQWAELKDTIARLPSSFSQCHIFFFWGLQILHLFPRAATRNAIFCRWCRSKQPLLIFSSDIHANTEASVMMCISLKRWQL